MITQKKSLALHAFHLKRASKNLAAIGILGLVTVAGCGGGGSSNGGTPSAPSAPSVPTQAAVSTAQAAAQLGANPSLPVSSATFTTLDSNITAAEESSVISQLSDPAQFAIAVKSASGATTITTASGIGLTQTQLNDYLVNDFKIADRISPGDSLQQVTVNTDSTQARKAADIITTFAIVSPTGAIKFSPILSFIQPSGNSDYKNTASNSQGDAATSIIAATNDFDKVVQSTFTQTLSRSSSGNPTSKITLDPKIVGIEATVLSGPTYNSNNTSVTRTIRLTFTIGGKLIWTVDIQITTTLPTGSGG